MPVSHRSCSGTPSGLANPLFQEGGRPRPGRRQLSLRDIGQPSLVSSTAAPRAARAHSPVLALRPPPGTPRAAPGRPPQVTGPPHGPSPACAGTALGRPGMVAWGALPPLPVPPRCPGEAVGSLSRQEKPKPPSKPLPALKSKVPSHGEGPSLPPTPFQRCPPPKVALRPPPARR